MKKMSEEEKTKAVDWFYDKVDQYKHLGYLVALIKAAQDLKKVFKLTLKDIQE